MWTLYGKHHLSYRQGHLHLTDKELKLTKVKWFVPVLLLEVWFQSPVPLPRLQRPQRSMYSRGKARHLNWESTCSSCQVQMGKWEMSKGPLPLVKDQGHDSQPITCDTCFSPYPFCLTLCINSVVLLFLYTVGSASLNRSWGKKKKKNSDKKWYWNLQPITEAVLTPWQENEHIR